MLSFWWLCLGADLSWQNMLSTSLDGISLDTGAIQVNITSITAQNAWKAVNIWTGVQNFKTKFVLTGWVTKIINTDNIEDSFKNTNTLKQKFKELASKKINAWTLQLKEPELIQYPDRLRVVQKSTVIFYNKMQLENYKKYIDTDIKDSSNVKKLEEVYFEKLYKECKKDKTCASTLTDTQIKDKVKYWIENGMKTMSSEEIIDYNLIPMDMETLGDLNSSWFNLNVEPGSVRMSADSIINRLRNVYHINSVAETIDEHLIEVETWVNEVPEDPVEAFCNQYYVPTEEDYTICVRLKKQLEQERRRTWSKKLLNWFTIWDSYSIMWRKTLSIDYFFWSKEVFYGRFHAVFGYDVWLRIPIIMKSGISDVTLTSAPDKNKFDFKFQIDTFDADAREYRSLWLSDNKIHDGKEFVLKLYANADARIDLLNETVFDREWDLISLLGRVLGISWLHNFDESKDFKPPFGSNERINILDLNYDIPIYSISVASIEAWLSIRSYIEWVIKTECSRYHVWGASCSTFTINNNNRHNLNNLEWRFISNDFRTDQIGRYSIVWLKFHDFYYFPRFVTEIRVSPSISVDIPLRWSETWHLGPYNLYRFQLDGPWLGTHRWTNWEVDLTGIKVYDKNYFPEKSVRKRLQQDIESQTIWQNISWAVLMTWTVSLISGAIDTWTTFSITWFTNTWNRLISWNILSWVNIENLIISDWLTLSGVNEEAKPTNKIIIELLGFYDDLYQKYEDKKITKEKFIENITNRIYILKEKYWDELTDELYKNLFEVIKKINYVKTEKDLQKIRDYIKEAEYRSLADTSETLEPYIIQLDIFIDSLKTKFKKMDPKAAEIKIKSIKLKIGSKIQTLSSLKDKKSKLLAEVLQYVVSNL